MRLNEYLGPSLFVAMLDMAENIRRVPDEPRRRAYVATVFCAILPRLYSAYPHDPRAFHISNFAWNLSVVCVTLREPPYIIVLWYHSWINKNDMNLWNSVPCLQLEFCFERFWWRFSTICTLLLQVYSLSFIPNSVEPNALIISTFSGCFLRMRLQRRSSGSQTMKITFVLYY